MYFLTFTRKGVSEIKTLWLVNFPLWADRYLSTEAAKYGWETRMVFDTDHVVDAVRAHGGLPEVIAYFVDTRRQYWATDMKGLAQARAFQITDDEPVALALVTQTFTEELRVEAQGLGKEDSWIQIKGVELLIEIEVPPHLFFAEMAYAFERSVINIKEGRKELLPIVIRR